MHRNLTPEEQESLQPGDGATIRIMKQGNKGKGDHGVFSIDTLTVIVVARIAGAKGVLYRGKLLNNAFNGKLKVGYELYFKPCEVVYADWENREKK